MEWELILYIIILGAGIVISLAIARYAWQRRSIPGVEYFVLYSLAAVLWALGTILGLVSTGLTSQQVWGAVGGLGVAIMPVAWLAFTLKYTGREKWLATRMWTLMAVVPVVAFLLIGSYSVYRAVQLGRGLTVGELNPLITMVAWGSNVYLSLLLLAGTLLIIQELIRAPRVYRGQYLSLLVGVSTPWFFGVLALWGLDFFALEWLFIAFVIGELVIAWGIFRHHIFDIMPIALDRVIESISDGVIVLDVRHRMVDVNPAAQRMIGRSAQQVAGWPIAQALPAWKDQLRYLRQEPAQAEIALEGPGLRGQRPAGSPGDVEAGQHRGIYELRTSPLHDRRNVLSGWLVLLRDITERKRAEEELRQVNQVRDRRNRELTLLNRVIAATTSRLEPQAVLEAVCRELTLAFSLPHAAAAMLAEDGASLSVVAEFQSEEFPSALGAVIPVEDNPATQYVLQHKVPLAVVDAQHDPRMEPIHDLMRQVNVVSLLILPLIVRDQVVGTIGLDAVERREFSDEEIALAANAAAAASQALENAQAEEALRESEETLKLAMEGAEIGLWDRNLATGEAVIIHDWIEPLGYESGMVEPSYETWYQLVHPDDRPKIDQAMRRYLSGDVPLFEVEHRVRAKSGGWEWVLLRGKAVVRDGQGRPLRIAGIHQNVTARVQADEELREAKELAEKAQQEAEAANQAKSVFLANMSHELRTHLNAILGFSQLMVRDPDTTASQHENLETIVRSGEHLLALINDVLDLSKIEAGRVTVQATSFNLHHLLRGLEEMFRLRTAEKGLMLIFDYAPGVPQFVRTDEGKLRQVLMNLLGNAAKFTQEGGVTLRIGAEDNRLVFEVEDTGPGIAPEELEAVFDPFVQTASGRAVQEGTGLGLPISRQFVRLMGGDLVVQSEPGTGSLFRFEVPIQLAEAVDVPSSQPERRVVGLEPDQPTYRLLVVDDRETSRKLLTRLLAPLGFEVREASDGQQAVEVWQAWQPDLIWMDMRMPVLDGYQATQRIKATTRGQATVVIALTASAFEEDRQVILTEGCDDFVRKPFREAEIFDKLEKHLGVRFVYEEVVPAGGVEDTPAFPDAGLRPDSLAELPVAWVTALSQAAEQADGDVILGLVEQIRGQHPPVADALANLVRNYRFDIIVALIEEIGG